MMSEVAYSSPRRTGRIPTVRRIPECRDSQDIPDTLCSSILGLVVSGQSGGSRTIKSDRTPGRIADNSRQPWTLWPSGFSVDYS